MSTGAGDAASAKSPLWKVVLGAFLSGRLYLFVLLLALCVITIVRVWNTEQEFWFSIAVQVSSGTALFLLIQLTPHRLIERTGAILIALAGLAALAVAFFQTGHLQALLVEIGAGAILFVGLEHWIGAVVMKGMKEREIELVNKTIEKITGTARPVVEPEPATHWSETFENFPVAGGWGLGFYNPLGVPYDPDWPPDDQAPVAVAEPAKKPPTEPPPAETPTP